MNLKSRKDRKTQKDPKNGKKLTVSHPLSRYSAIPHCEEDVVVNFAIAPGIGIGVHCDEAWGILRGREIEWWKSGKGIARGEDEDDINGAKGGGLINRKKKRLSKMG